MTQASVIAVAGVALLVAWPDGPVGAMLSKLPPVACAQAAVRTVEERVDYLGDVLRQVEQGTVPDALPPPPSDARLAVCHTLT